MPQIYRVSQFAYYDIRAREPYSAYRIDRQPAGPLAQIVCCKSEARNRINGPGDKTVWAIKAPLDSCSQYELTRWETLPALMTFLAENNYDILPNMEYALVPDKNFMIRYNN